MTINIIDLKTDSELFQQTIKGAKTFEIRLNDRSYKVGDILVLHETKSTGDEMSKGAPLVFTGHTCDLKVTHILSGYGLNPDWVVMSVKSLKEGE